MESLHKSWRLIKILDRIKTRLVQKCYYCLILNSKTDVILQNFQSTTKKLAWKGRQLLKNKHIQERLSFVKIYIFQKACGKIVIRWNHSRNIRPKFKTICVAENWQSIAFKKHQPHNEKVQEWICDMVWVFLCQGKGNLSPRHEQWIVLGTAKFLLKCYWHYLPADYCPYLCQGFSWCALQPSSGTCWSRSHV